MFSLYKYENMINERCSLNDNISLLYQNIRSLYNKEVDLRKETTLSFVTTSAAWYATLLFQAMYPFITSKQVAWSYFTKPTQRKEPD
ncbi:2624_t:CDS:2 [Gigaspora margarita]|uniref:2624_t:CDS:1 n=1 Tax=Gigaspora margarita TaxID=4874 RepID=A0ABN7VGG9_GIGMA|nr:2624_t:CDS:2 [Gigaspora margarita]